MVSMVRCFCTKRIEKKNHRKNDCYEDKPALVLKSKSSSSSSSKRSENDEFVMLVRVGNLGPDCLSVVGVDAGVRLFVGTPTMAGFCSDGDLQYFIPSHRTLHIQQKKQQPTCLKGGGYQEAMKIKRLNFYLRGATHATCFCFFAAG